MVPLMKSIVDSRNKTSILLFAFLIFTMQALLTAQTPLLGVRPPGYVVKYNMNRILRDRNSEETADWGDVVNVNFSLWLDAEHTIESTGNMGINLYYVYLRRSQTEQVPSEVYQALPADSADALLQVYLHAFIDEIIGMQIKEEKSFMIAAADAYGDEDLFYSVTLLAILYDASATTVSKTTCSIPSFPTTTTSETSALLPNITSFPDFFFTVLLFSASIIVVIERRKRKKHNR